MLLQYSWVCLSLPYAFYVDCNWRDIGRLLRYLASIAIIGETGENTYVATKMTDAITVPGYQSGLLIM